ncbi:MAG TPA: hypothetical protein P5534_02300 [Candidatus Paceibacterota bacterium]|nr:hypothetical protein [Candidatus Paceibacterota bacterium]HRZ55588.1 hypothetical protein [Candidatus Paceibacterota bacterium]
MPSESPNIFDTEPERYEVWFDSPEGGMLFENELAAIRWLWRDHFRPALEVGVGTGRSAQTFDVEWGLNRSRASVGWL